MENKRRSVTILLIVIGIVIIGAISVIAFTKGKEKNIISEGNISDNDMNVSDKNDQTINENSVQNKKTNKKSEFVKRISGNEKEYYGKVVSNYVTGNSEVDKELQKYGIEWMILYAGENPGTGDENIYLIASDYVPISTLPKNDKLKKKEDSYDIAAFSADLVSDYEGSSDIQDERIKGLNNDYFNIKKYKSSKYNMKVLAYMLDINEWNRYYTNVEYAEYAIGGPTIEMLISSNNQLYGTEYECKAENEDGYISRKSGSTAWSKYTFIHLEKTDKLYVSNRTEPLKRAAWMASTPSISSAMVNGLDGNGVISSSLWDSVAMSTFDDIWNAFRPVICLNSDVELIASGGEYIIK